MTMQQSKNPARAKAVKVRRLAVAPIPDGMFTLEATPETGGRVVNLDMSREELAALHARIGEALGDDTAARLKDAEAEIADLRDRLEQEQARARAAGEAAEAAEKNERALGVAASAALVEAGITVDEHTPEGVGDAIRALKKQRDEARGARTTLPAVLPPLSAPADDKSQRRYLAAHGWSLLVRGNPFGPGLSLWRDPANGVELPANLQATCVGIQLARHRAEERELYRGVFIARSRVDDDTEAAHQQAARAVEIYRAEFFNGAGEDARSEVASEANGSART